MEEEGVDSQFSCTSSEHQLPVLMPSRVGREFVRQYYRLLHKAPELLHRFYTNDSTCTHGDFDMALGKRDIQTLFRRENYTDCSTKILHIDIHGTLVNGVVVLVTGEQSNAGFPMRPFVQTFVLAAQGPRRYYVCNDIFRYTDAFVKPCPVVDVECQTSILHIGDGDQQYHYMQQQKQQQKQMQGQQELEELTSENDIYATISTDRAHPSTVDSSSVRIHVSDSCAIPMPRWASSRHHKDINLNAFTQPNQMDQLGSHCDDKDDGTTGMIAVNEYIKQGQNQQECPFYRSLIAQALTPNIEFEDMTTISNTTYENSTYYRDDVGRVSIGVSSGILKRHTDNLLGMQQQQNNNRDCKECISYNYQQADNSQTQSNETTEKMPTYAKLLMSAFTRASLKNNQNNKMNMNTSSIVSPLRATTIHTFSSNNMNQQNNEDNMNASPNSSSPVSTITDHQEHSFTAAPAQNFFPIQRNNYTQGIRRNDRRRASSAQKYDDNQQLFLGQIPHNATEEELISIFSCFGNVLELRILPNLGGKIQPGAKHPLKYGFLTFEHVESVKACLESRPVFFPNNSPDGQKLNVRAKKPSVARDDTPQACQSLDSQSMSNDWLKTSTRRNNSVGHNIVGSGSSNGGNVIFNRKDNRHNRGASLDSGTQIQGGKKFIQPAGAGGPGCCGRR